MPIIRFVTTHYRPELLVTVRSSLDWAKDVAGTYQGDTWLFELSAVPADGLAFKFVLERQYWMTGRKSASAGRRRR